jgi:hypothetical protein
VQSRCLLRNGSQGRIFRVMGPVLPNWVRVAANFGTAKPANSTNPDEPARKASQKPNRLEELSAA